MIVNLKLQKLFVPWRGIVAMLSASLCPESYSKGWRSFKVAWLCGVKTLL